MNNRSNEKPVVGLIVPPLSGEVPPEALMYPEIDFIAEGLGLRSVDPEGYDEVISSVVEKAKKLVQRGAQAVSLMGTSLSFYRGHEANEQMIKIMEQESGVPCTTMSQAILRALEAVEAKKIAIATSYVDVVNEHLVAFMQAGGYEVTSCVGLGVNGVEAMAQIGTKQLVDLCLKAYETGEIKADAILLSCGGLRTLETIKEVEQHLGIPVIASSPAGFWDVAGLIDARIAKTDFGRLAEVKRLSVKKLS